MRENKHFFEFPVGPISKIKENCILDAIVHALQNCIYPYFDYEKSWCDSNFSIINSEGTRATITFKSSYIVIGIRSDGIKNYYGDSDDNPLVKFAPQNVRDIATQQTLQYLLVERNDITIPTISAFLWIYDSKAVSFQSYSELMNSGLETIDYLLFGKDKLMDYWKEYYEINENQINFAFEMYNGYTNSITDSFTIRKETIEERYGHMVTRECIESFSEIGILVI